MAVMSIITKIDQLAGQLATRAGSQQSIELPLLPGCSEAVTIWAISKAFNRTVLWIADGQKALVDKHRDLSSLLEQDDNAPGILFYPPWESLPGQSDVPSPDIAGQRIEVLSDLTHSETPSIIVTSVQALMQLTLSHNALAGHTAAMTVGDDIDAEGLRRKLVDAGYSFEVEVDAKGQAAVRGGLLDVWPLTEQQPMRLEFFGDTLESARTFDPVSQKSTGPITDVRLTPTREWDIVMSDPSEREQFASHLPEDSIVIWSEVMQIEAQAQAYEELVAESGVSGLTIDYNTMHARLARQATLEVTIGSDAIDTSSTTSLGFASVQGAAQVTRDLMEPDIMDERRKQFLVALRALAKDDILVCIFFDTEGARKRYRETHARSADKRKEFELKIGTLSSGFINRDLQLAVIAESDLYGQRKGTRARYDPKQRPKETSGASREWIATPADLEADDLVVHVQHGIGRFMGLTEITIDDVPQEVLTLEYADGARLHVPVSQSHLLSRYVGIGRRKVALHRLGSKRWSREKSEAHQAVQDFAAALLETQASRDVLRGYAFGPDTKWQHEFEMSFPYTETPDQEQAIRDTKKDMESPRPMDRLVCGDVGFGKTEIAIRAAFKAVMAGKQVVVLVPTTILCQQHFRTFTERMTAYPVRVEMLSRFCAKSSRDRTIEDMKKGTVDIVIGTHCLLQPGISFSELGLVIIDEEQRFGVMHKEKLKQMRQMVDVLTMTATPIPRTLYMSMTGVKDLSTVQSPPQHRLPIETIVASNSKDIIRTAILREIGREGQVYYLYNRVMTIARVHAKLRRIVPEARIAVGHGQMSASELATVMRDFVQGKYDVLLCTTIIESGLDIPNVNTIIIDRADRFGIADLYQLRGRVGRSTKRAYAYFLLPEHARMDPSARHRVDIIKRYSELGSGFSLALRDLEIRGAGSILGTQQSGHVAAVGFVLYCQLLRRAVARLKGKPVSPVVDVALRLDFISLAPDAVENDNAALIPADYIEDERLRVSAYRKLASAGTAAEVRAVKRDLKDRFGKPAASFERLVKLALIRVAAAAHNIDTVETREDRILFMKGRECITTGSKLPRMTSSAPDKKLADILRHLKQMA